ncbi:pentapeptide repeat-containing protein [Candidatus Pacearchaeota archaeon]|nr:pentapeptide repeat-containing protein [Candidatus Pacearchaeota archaeon]
MNDKAGNSYPRYDEEQFAMLKRCSDAGDITEWNKWREENPSKDICLDGACLKNFILKDVLLTKGSIEKLGDDPEIHLEGEVYLREAFFRNADLENARFDRAHLEDADFYLSKIRGADFGRAHLQGTSFKLAIVDGSTLLWDKKTGTERDVSRPCCRISKETDFEGVPLDSIRVDPHTKQLLEYNIRCKNWKDWYRGESEKRWKQKLNQFLTFPVRLLWQISDYGRSEGRIVFWFFWLAIMFACVYHIWPSCVQVNGKVGAFNDFFHAIYFSIVTMTTLGFGDISANPESWLGQLLLMLQVLLGYVLLGALITRFAVLFTAGGPAGKFTEMDKSLKKGK